MKKAIIILIGIVLIAATVATGSEGISKKNIEIYERAVLLESGRDNLGFADFALTDYSVAFYDGDNDYVFKWNNDNYSISKREAVMDLMVATAYPYDGHYEVLAPTVERLSSVLAVMSAGEYEYDIEEQVSTIWHEAFHCYQLTNYLENIEEICYEDIDETLIAECADSAPQAVALFEQQAELLEEAVRSDSVDKVRECILKYKQLDTERRALLSDDVIAIEEYYTRVEGTACYAEACIYKMQKPDKFEGSYIDGISEYSGGSEKYYRIGMAECMLLDIIDSSWKKDYDFSEPLINLIYRELGI